MKKTTKINEMKKEASKSWFQQQEFKNPNEITKN